MRWLMNRCKLFRTAAGGQRGQSAMFLILLSVFIAATAALAVDIGLWVRDGRHAQNDADAIVLAGVQELPQNGTAAAIGVAEEWAARNGVAMEDLECCTFEDRDGDGREDTISATVFKKSKSIFARIIGFGDPTLKRDAAAMRPGISGASVMPWAVFCRDDFEFPTRCGLEDGERFGFHWGDKSSPGNFDALAIDGNGASHYRQAIESEGGTSKVIMEGEDIFLMSKPGNMGKNTCDALHTRALNWGETVPGCGPKSSGKAECDADTAEEAAAKAASCPGRTVVLPITEEFEQGRDEVQVFALGWFYIASWDRQNPYGDDFDADGDGRSDMVWGFFLPDETLPPEFLVEIDVENPTSNPFAPRVAVLVE